MPFSRLRRTGIILILVTISALALIGGVVVSNNSKEPARSFLMASSLTESDRLTAQRIYLKVCAGCHGVHLEGATGPSLNNVANRYSIEKLARIAQNGKGRKKAAPMPSGLVSATEARLLARWLHSSAAPASR